MEQLAKLNVQNVTKRYGKTLALDQFSIDFAPGRVTGLLGRNGAGKTTLLGILSGQLFANEGQTLLNDQPIPENATALDQICLVREKTPYIKEYRIRDVLAMCRDRFVNWDQSYSEQLIERFELNPKKRIKQLSRGMESSLGLIVGLSSRSHITMFDEPSLGLDAVMREAFYDEIIRDLPDNPRTIIISTHLIDEVSRLFEDVAVVEAGKLLYHGSLDALLSSACYVTGPKEQVTKAISGLTLLHDEQLGGARVACVQGTPQPVDGVSVEGVPLQKLFVYLTENSRIHQKGGVHHA